MVLARQRPWKLWTSGTVGPSAHAKWVWSRQGACPSPVIGIQGCHPQKTLENIGANLHILLLFQLKVHILEIRLTSGYQKWHGIWTLLLVVMVIYYAHCIGSMTTVARYYYVHSSTYGDLCVPHVSTAQEMDVAGEHLLCPVHGFGTSCWLLSEPLHWHNGLFQTSIEGVHVSCSGRHVADCSTSEELS